MSAPAAPALVAASPPTAPDAPPDVPGPAAVAEDQEAGDQEGEDPQAPAPPEDAPASDDDALPIPEGLEDLLPVKYVEPDDNLANRVLDLNDEEQDDLDHAELNISYMREVFGGYSDEALGEMTTGDLRLVARRFVRCLVCRLVSTCARDG